MEKLTECERLCSLVCWVRIKQLLWVSNWQTNVYPLSHFILSVSLSVNSMNEQMKEFSNFGELFLLYNILVNKNSHFLFWLVINVDVNANKNTSNSFHLKFSRKKMLAFMFLLPAHNRNLQLHLCNMLYANHFLRSIVISCSKIIWSI